MSICAKKFNWDLTNRKYMLLIPNYKRRKLLIPSIESLRTNADRRDWGVLIINDGVDEDFSSIECDNVFSITLGRKGKNISRNGLFARNYCIKRMMCQYLFQKDPEIVIRGDVFNKPLDEHDVYRAGKVISLNKKIQRYFVKKENSQRIH